MTTGIYIKYTMRLCFFPILVFISVNIITVKAASLFPEPAKIESTVIIRDDDLQSGVYNWTSENEYLIDGQVFLEAGGNLFIEEGTVIRFKESPTVGVNSSALIITRGSKIFAEGTPDNPIIFTAEADTDGTNLDPLRDKAKWSGIIVLGAAPIMSKGLTELHHQAFSEDDNRAKYGGNNPDDDSGILKYVSIRYTGMDLNSAQPEALRLGAIGKNTLIDHIEIFSTKHDGIEIWGGNVNVNYLSVSFAGDESIEVNNGWRGTGQFWFALERGTFDPTADWQGEFENNGVFYSAPIISNMTFIGPGTNSNFNDVALVLQDGFAGKVANSIFEDYPSEFVIVEDILNDSDDAHGRMVSPTEEGFQLEIKNNTLSRFGNFDKLSDIVRASDVDGFIGNTEDVINELKLNNNEITQESVLLGISRDPNGALNPKPVSTSAVLDIFSESMASVNYRGAFNPATVNTWLHGWTSLAKSGYLVPVVVPQLVNKTFESKPGDQISIEGTNLGLDVEAIKITVGGQVVTQKSLSGNSLSFEIPADLDTREQPYEVVVRVLTVKAEGDVTITIVPDQPRLIDGLIETTSGAQISIEGENLGSDIDKIAITIGSLPVTEKAISGNTLTLELPAGLNPREEVYEVVVSVNGVEATGNVNVKVNFDQPRLIDGLIETTSGAQISIEGENLGSDIDKIAITIGGLPVTEKAISGNTLTLELPAGLNPREEVYEVVVSVNGVEATGNVNVKVNPLPLVVIDNVSFVSSYNRKGNSEFRLTVELNNNDFISSDFRYKGITDEAIFDDALQKAITSSGLEHQVSLMPDDLQTVLNDPLGMQFEISFTVEGGERLDTTGIVYWRYGDEEINLETTRWKNVRVPETPSLTDYNLIAFPFEDQNVSNILQLGSYDTTKWRLFSYDPNLTGSENDKFREFGNFNQFSPQQGYALIMLDGNQISFGGQIPEMLKEDDKLHYEITLRDGWNLIGNPYPFDISWEIVKEANPGLTIGNVNRISSAGYEDTSNKLNSFEGAFVFHQGSDIVVKVPIQTGLVNSRRIKRNDKEGGWNLPIYVESNGIINRRNGIGMEVHSKDSWDIHDAVQLPKLMDYPEILMKDEKTGVLLNRSIVPPKETYLWQAELTGGQEGEIVKLSWNTAEIPESVAGIFLWDKLNSRLVDMRQLSESHFQLPEGGNLPLQIYYGAADDIFSVLDISQIRTGKSYPNPVGDKFMLPLSIPVEQQLSLGALLIVYNNQGQQVAEYSFNQLTPGYQELEVPLPQGLRSGLYHYQLRITGTESSTITGRIIKQ